MFARKLYKPLLIFLLGGHALTAAAAEIFSQGFLKKHCTECHDADAKKGGLDLTTLKPDFADAQNFTRWVRIHDRVAKGEMPPKKQTPPPVAEREGFVGALRKELHEVSQIGRAHV